MINNSQAADYFMDDTINNCLNTIIKDIQKKVLLENYVAMLSPRAQQRVHPYLGGLGQYHQVSVMVGRRGDGV